MNALPGAPSLTPPQLRGLRARAGLERSVGKMWPQTKAALQRHSLIDKLANPTPLGLVAATMHGWVPNDDQQALLLALDNGHVRPSVRYDLDGAGIAPALVLSRFAEAGLATVQRTKPLVYGRTLRGAHLAALLRGEAEAAADSL